MAPINPAPLRCSHPPPRTIEPLGYPLSNAGRRTREGGNPKQACVITTHVRYGIHNTSALFQRFHTGPRFHLRFTAHEYYPTVRKTPPDSKITPPKPASKPSSPPRLRYREGLLGLSVSRSRLKQRTSAV